MKNILTFILLLATVTKGAETVHFPGYPDLCAHQANCQLIEMGSQNELLLLEAFTVADSPNACLSCLFSIAYS